MGVLKFKRDRRRLKKYVMHLLARVYLYSTSYNIHGLASNCVQIFYENKPNFLKICIRETKKLIMMFNISGLRYLKYLISGLYSICSRYIWIFYIC